MYHLRLISIGTPISCGVVTRIKGGRAIRNETHHGGKVVFECLNANYTMEGKKGMRCISGKWNRNKPKCLGKLTKNISVH